MMDRKHLSELSQLLAATYDSMDAPLRLARDAGLKTEEISGRTSPRQLWSEIVEYARNRNALDRLAEQVLAELDVPPQRLPSMLVERLREIMTCAKQPSAWNGQHPADSVKSAPASSRPLSSNVAKQITEERLKRLEKIKSLLNSSAQTAKSDTGEGKASLGAELCNKLAPIFGTHESSHTDAIARVAEVVVSGPIEEVTNKIAKFIRSEACTSEDMRRLARKLVWYALPAIFGIQEMIPIAKRAAGPQGRNPVELVLNWELTTEIVMAGIDGRACDFVVVEKRTQQGAKVPTPQGAGQIPLPSAAFAPIFDCNGESTVRAVLKNIRSRDFGLLKNKYLPDLDGDDADLRASAQRDAAYHIDKRLARAAENDEHPMRHYLLFIDDEQLREHGYDRRALDSRWNMLCQSLARMLPNLRVVRMKHNDENSRSEIDILDCVEPLIPVEE